MTHSHLAPSLRRTPWVDVLLYGAAGLWFLTASFAIFRSALAEVAGLYFVLFPVVLVARSASRSKRVGHPIARVVVALGTAFAMIMLIVGTWGAAAALAMSAYAVIWTSRLAAWTARRA